MNRGLAKAVIAAFREEDAAILRRRFAPFDEIEWLRSKEWLHTSGLALYFLARARALGIEEVMPARLLRELNVNLAENRMRTQDLFNEFVRINVEFQRARLSYANLKGFTLAPRAFPDPALRYQHDLDFQVSWRDAERCGQALERHGYRRSAVFGDTWEFRAGPAEVSSMRDLYKTRSQRSLEVHFVTDQERNKSNRQDHRLSRLQLQVWNGFEFPALSESDKVLAQAMHLFKHFQTEWTRTAWMLEYANAICSHRNDESFWSETTAGVEAAQETKVGIGMACLITSRAFGVTPPAQFLSHTVDEMPKQLRLWVDRYEDELVFVEFPGSKLYLLLQDVLLRDSPDWQSQRRGKLIPSGLPPKHISSSPGNSSWHRAHTSWARLRFVWARFRFHVAEGIRYKIEAARWKRFVGDMRA